MFADSSLGSYGAWLVDLDGTLYRATPVKALMAAELALRGWHAVRILREFRRQHEQLRQQPDAADPDPFAAQLASTAKHLAISHAEVATVVERWMFERPCRWLPHFKREELFDALARYRAVGGRTALVSDYPARRKLQALGAERLFDAVIAPGEVLGPKRLKPDPEGYLRAADALGLAPARCLVLGDRQDADGEAAARAGMHFRKVG